MTSIRTAGGANASAAPSTRRMLAAQLLAILTGLPVAVLLTGSQVAPFFNLLGRAGVNAQALGAGSAFTTYFLQGALLAMPQIVVLRAYVARPTGWVVASGLLGVCLLPGLFPVTAWLMGGEPSLAQVHSLPGLLLCAVAGALFGLLLGLVQTFWLSAGAQRWIVCSSISWAGLWSAIFPIIYTSIYQ